MKHTVPHDLDDATAHRVVEKAFDAYKQRFTDYRPSIRWTTPEKAVIGFSAKGLSLEGAIELVPRGVTIELDVPFLFRVFRGRAIEIIDREIRVWIQKAKAGQI